MIFLFHAPEDEELAEHIGEELKVIGEVKTWAENNNLASPLERTEAMRKDLDNAQFRVVVFSQDAFERRRPRQLLREFDKMVREFKNDRQLAGAFFPIRIDDCIMPIWEEHFPYYTLFEEGGLEQVIRVIQKTLEPPEELPDGEFLFFRDNWRWKLQFQDSPVIADHRRHTGFAYLHFILNSGAPAVSIDWLKKVVTKLYQPSRHELLGLDEDGDKIETDPERRKKTHEELEADRELFRQIRDEIIFAIQSLPAGNLQEFFVNAVKFGGDEYVIYNSFWEGKKVEWRLYQKR